MIFSLPLLFLFSSFDFRFFTFVKSLWLYAPLLWTKSSVGGQSLKMGRVKLKIKRLESTSNRQVTYSKRRNGILKKARELSILCDIDIVLLMFSPTGRPTVFNGERSNIEEVIAKFSQLTPQERAKRKLESLEALKKTFKKLDHDVNIQEFLGSSNQTAEGLTNHVTLMQTQIAEIQRRLSYWTNVDNIDNLGHLTQLEQSLSESLHRIRLHKESFTNNQLILPQCTTSQFQERMSLPLGMGGLQEAHSISWLSDNDNQHLMLPSESNFIPNKEIECSVDASIAGYSGFFCSDKQPELCERAPGDNKGGNIGDSSRTSLQLAEQYAYSPYSNYTLQDDKKLKKHIEMNMQGNSTIYQQPSTNFELPQPGFDTSHHAWVPEHSSCHIPMFGESSCHQQPN